MAANGYSLPTRNRRQRVVFEAEGIKGLPGRKGALPWVDLKKIEGDEDTVTFYSHQEEGPYTVNIEKNNQEQILGLRGIIEHFFIQNDIAKFNPDTENYEPMPEFDFEKLADFELEVLSQFAPPMSY